MMVCGEQRRIDTKRYLPFIFHWEVSTVSFVSLPWMYRFESEIYIWFLETQFSRISFRRKRVRPFIETNVREMMEASASILSQCLWVSLIIFSCCVFNSSFNFSPNKRWWGEREKNYKRTMCPFCVSFHLESTLKYQTSIDNHTHAGCAKKENNSGCNQLCCLFIASSLIEIRWGSA